MTCLRWGGEGLIYTGSQDRTIKVYAAENVRAVHISPSPFLLLLMVLYSLLVLFSYEVR